MTHTTQAPGELPPLPRPELVSYQLDSVMRKLELQSFTADQMREYALAALRSAGAAQAPAQPAEPVRAAPPAGWRNVLKSVRLGLAAGSRSPSNTDFEVEYGGALLDAVFEKLEALEQHLWVPCDCETSVEREAFEAWLIQHQRALGYGKCLSDDELVARGANGVYLAVTFEKAWEAWQAALASQPTPEPSHIHPQGAAQAPEEAPMPIRLRRLHELLDSVLGMGLEPEDDAVVLDAQTTLASMFIRDATQPPSQQGAAE